MVMRLSVLVLLTILASCGSDSPVQPPPGDQGKYRKVLTSEAGAGKFEVWSSSGTSLIYGYNDVGFKVYDNGSEVTGGFVKYKPTMYHGIGGPSHSVPVSPVFTYDNSDKMYKGYIIFIMYDTSAFWTADYNCNDQIFVDSAFFDISMDARSQVRAWDNSTTQRTYILTLVSPLSPNTGLNDLNLMLHETIDLDSYVERDSASMFVRTWMPAYAHSSENNVNPVFIGNGNYKGKINLTRAGLWQVYDSITYRGSTITRNPPPRIEITAE